jgi:hypothetical protein
MSRRRAALLCIPLLVGWPNRGGANETSPPPDAPYDEQFIGFDDFGGVVSHDGLVTGTVEWSVPYVGKYKQPLVGADFYRKVGRNDLAARYDDHMALKTGLIAGGVIVAIATSIVGIVLLSSGHEDCRTATQPSPTANANFAACVDRNIHSGPDGGALALAIGGPLLGAVLAVAGSTIDPDPVDLVERRRLAAAHNRALRERENSGSSVPEIQVRPMLGSSGAGLAIALPL